MPELPEVETVCRGLNQLTSNQEIGGGEVLLERTLAYPISAPAFLAEIEGTAIARWQRRGKYLLAQLVRPAASQPAGWLGVHLRMTGQLLWVMRSQPLQKHTRVRLWLGSDRELRFVDTRTFGKMWWVPPDRPPEQIITGLQKLGPEPFSTDFTPEYLAQKLRKSQRSIKSALLDQTLVAGLGNIYADESLFKSGIRPTAIASQLHQHQFKSLHAAILEVLQVAIEQGGTTISDFLNPFGVNGNYGGLAWVYGRKGEPCRACNSPIEHLKLVGRSTHFCPQCQR